MVQKLEISAFSMTNRGYLVHNFRQGEIRITTYSRMIIQIGTIITVSVITCILILPPVELIRLRNLSSLTRLSQDLSQSVKSGI